MLQRVDTTVTRRSMIGIAAIMIAAATPFRLVAMTPPPQPVLDRSTTSARTIPVFLSQDPDHLRVTLSNGAAAQGPDAAGLERKTLDEQRRRIEEARRMLEAREAETRESLRKRRADLEAARAEMEHAQRSGAAQLEALARELADRRLREAAHLRDAMEFLAAQREELARLSASQQAVMNQLRERAQAQQREDFATTMRQLAAAAAALRAQRASTENYSRGDLIVLSPDRDGSRPPNSRVLAVAGDRLRVATTGILVNGEPVGGLSPEFLAGLPKDPWEETVAPGHYFVAADERSASGASRFWGLIPAGRIIGRP